MTVKGWWRIAVSNRVLNRLDKIRDGLTKEGNQHISYNSTIEILIQNYALKDNDSKQE